MSCAAGTTTARDLPTISCRSWTSPSATSPPTSAAGGEPEKDGNSIFIFEVADLCIGHLGHLHHVPTEDQFARIGRLDIVMAPVDGTMTLDLPRMIHVLKRLKARIVLPMHYWGTGTLSVFLHGMADEFQVVALDSPTIEVSYDSLPGRPTVMVPTLDPTLDPNFGLD